MPKGRGLLVVSSYSGNTLEEHSFTIHLQSAGVSTLNFHPQHFPRHCTASRLLYRLVRELDGRLVEAAPCYYRCGYHMSWTRTVTNGCLLKLRDYSPPWHLRQSCMHRPDLTNGLGRSSDPGGLLLQKRQGLRQIEHFRGRAARSRGAQ